MDEKPSHPLDVAAVMRRYNLADPRSARRIMDEAGAFKVAGKLLVDAASLTDYEDRLRSERATTRTTPRPGSRPGTRPSRSRRSMSKRPRYWWREQDSRADRSSR